MNNNEHYNVVSSAEEPAEFAREYEKLWTDVEDIETVGEEEK